MSTDQDFAARLRVRAEAVAPPVTVDVSRVVRRGRRRRVAGRTAVAALTVVALGGAGLAASTRLGLVEPTVLTPALPALPWDEPTSVPSTSATVQPDGTVAGGASDPWAGDELYWYTAFEATQTDVASGATRTFRRESWTSRERPGLLVEDGDVAGAGAVGPHVVIGRFRVDGLWVDMLDDPGLLPTEPAALGTVLRDSVEPDRRQGSADDKVVDMVADLLREGGLLPAALRDAAWQVGAQVPGATVTDGTDSTGRPGQVLHYTPTWGASLTYVRDPATGLLLEEVDERGWHAVYLEQRAVDATPVPPTLELSGCASWAGC